MERTKTILASLNNRLDLLALIHPESNVCEVGVRMGEYLKMMQARSPRHLVGVDVWDGAQTVGQNDIGVSQDELRAYRVSVQNWAQHYGNVSIEHALSLNAAAGYEDEYFDWVYLDADHTYEAVKADIAAWWPKVASGGVLSGHDYIDVATPNGAEFGVIRAVDEFVRLNNLVLYLDKDTWKSWAVIKP
jgi:hypothetical protein